MGYCRAWGGRGAHGTCVCLALGAPCAAVAAAAAAADMCAAVCAFQRWLQACRASGHINCAMLAKQPATRCLTCRACCSAVPCTLLCSLCCYVKTKRGLASRVSISCTQAMHGGCLQGFGMPAMYTCTNRHLCSQMRPIVGRSLATWQASAMMHHNISCCVPAAQ